MDKNIENPQDPIRKILRSYKPPLSPDPLSFDFNVISVLNVFAIIFLLITYSSPLALKIRQWVGTVFSCISLAKFAIALFTPAILLLKNEPFQFGFIDTTVNMETMRYLDVYISALLALLHYFDSKVDNCTPKKSFLRFFITLGISCMMLLFLLPVCEMLNISSLVISILIILLGMVVRLSNIFRIGYSYSM